MLAKVAIISSFGGRKEALVHAMFGKTLLT